MRSITTLIAVAVASAAAIPASAQTANPVRPYVGIVGGSESYDRDGPSGDLVGVIGGLDYDLGESPMFVGVEANAMKGFGDIDAEYGFAGTFGTRAYVGGAWKLFVKAGVQRVDFEGAGGDTRFLTGMEGRVPISPSERPCSRDRCSRSRDCCTPAVRP